MRAAKIVEDAKAKFRVHPTVMVPLGSMNPAPYNPNKISPSKLDALKANIREHGFLDPVVIQKASPKYGPMVLVGGHQRLRAVREIAVEDNVTIAELPAIVIDVEDRAAKKLNIALNRAKGEPDAKLLGELLEDINHEQLLKPEEILHMGFEDDEFARYLKLSEPPVIADSDPAEPRTVKLTLALEFKDVGMRDAVKLKLHELATAAKKTPGEIVNGLLGGTSKKKR